MPSYFKKHKMRYPLYGIMVVSAVLLVFIGIQSTWIALIGTLLLLALFYAALHVEKEAAKATEEYITTLSYRVKKVGEEALMDMPIGIMLINDDYQIEWTNPFMASCFNENTLAGRSLYDVGEQIIPLIKQDIDTEIVTINERKYNVILKLEEKLLYFFDVTDQIETVRRYEAERNVIAFIFLDNYDDATQGMDDQARSGLNSTVTSLLNEWALEHGIFLKRTSSDRFVTLLNEKILRELEMEKFSILDTVRETTAKQNVPLTLSIGVGIGELTLPELGVLAQSSLDLALGRGGDQVALKLPNGKLKFYGGKTNPMEKRTRVRARVISHALKELIVESDQVIVMGHKYPDMDAIGASIGIRKAAEMNHREGYIVVNFSEIDTGVQRLIEEMKAYPDLYSRLITPEEALELATENTLLVVVDTHKPSLVIEEKLLNKTDRVVVIDHHRRSEDFIKKPLLVYMEPYASSTAELVTELLEYQPKNGKINSLEATALLSGIIVDTKSFTLRTGSRTFDAASYLRSQGADTVLVQKFLKEDVDTYIKRSKLIETVEFYRDGIAIASGKEDEIYDPVLIAQAADTLLTMDNVSASFVISKRAEDIVGISARSLGEINVQILMEALGGGGHLSNAAVQLPGEKIVEVELVLKQAIDDYLEGSQES
ncbi:DHH family phosphoesterase [Lederbergia citrea]|uniref:Cyclic-di-AMP phosphodiesterase n=1 Tax=Lederbergia citrea TaxID=2833581 RepID=A0A942USB6_9BACI|nr:DHH family phosphoesterase [Lederbergia citrea]MBS4177627.1 DHH family phosphoesterase [Lederbergia citrea]MBS4204301.1 DHH family phosphoesterase [Lederbergia citrea]MBS4223868.1 DHH family phosphoesterase [Lederbergia citrea]